MGDVILMLCAQKCLHLCDPMDCSLPGSSVHGIFQARVLEWVAISSPRDLPDAGIEPGSPALQADALPSEPQGVCRGCILSLCLFNLYAEYIIQNARLDEAQAGIKIAKRHINNLRYADDTIFMVESEEELKSLLMKVKEESGKSWLKSQHSKN